ISFNANHWFEEHKFLAPVKQFNKFIAEILLKQISQKIIIFIDEINQIIDLNKKFEAHELLGYIRDCYNTRSFRPEYERITFVLLGFASPSDLIKNPAQSPFNIGQKIELDPFTLEDIEPLKKGLEGKLTSHDLIDAVMSSILDWTGGQPFLTQKVCNLVRESGEIIIAANQNNQVEAIVTSKIIKDWKKNDNPDHLKTIETKIVNIDNEINQMILLEYYRNILDNGIAETDIDSESLVKLKLSGLIVQKGAHLEVYNKIYQLIFNEQWINTQIDKICLYGQSMNAWYDSACKDNSLLLKPDKLKQAEEWSANQPKSNRQFNYLNASQKFIAKKHKEKLLLVSLSCVISASLLSIGLTLFTKARQELNNYAECPVGKLTNGICFRKVITNGDSAQKTLFLSQNNYYLREGSKAFNQKKYKQAINFFARAIDADPSDPISQIYLNNVRAIQQGNPLKLAVAVPIDYYEKMAKEILRGVADAQDKFNKLGGKNGRLLEIVIANDGDEPKVVENVAQDLVTNTNILGIIGHNSSESSEKALPIYEKNNLALVSATSTSSKLKSLVLFRTVAPTTESAKKYAEYLKNQQKVDKLIIFTTPIVFIVQVLWKI
ncbi:MAG: AAA-like domain-containing protein, partial [Snowella sp.]